MLRAVLVVAACLAASTAAAQSPDAFEQASLDARMGTAEAFARLEVDGAFGDPADAFAFFIYWDRPYGVDGNRRWFGIRKASRTEVDPTWATSAMCPAINGLMEAMEEIEPPKIDVWGVGQEYTPAMVADGVMHRFWIRWPRWPDATGSELRFSGNVDTPLAAWTRRLYAETEGCWQREVPEAG